MPAKDGKMRETDVTTVKQCIDENMIFDWDIQGNNITNIRTKDNIYDVFRMFDDGCEDWNVDKLIYNK